MIPTSLLESFKQDVVYCKDCKHHYFPNWDGYSIYDYCLKTISFEDTPIQRVKKMLTCEESTFNDKNNCNYYEPSRWKRLRDYFNRRGEK